MYTAWNLEGFESTCKSWTEYFLEYQAAIGKCPSQQTAHARDLRLVAGNARNAQQGSDEDGEDGDRDEDESSSSGDSSEQHSDHGSLGGTSRACPIVPAAVHGVLLHIKVAILRIIQKHLTQCLGSALCLRSLCSLVLRAGACVSFWPELQAMMRHCRPGLQCAAAAACLHASSTGCGGSTPVHCYHSQRRKL